VTYDVVVHPDIWDKLTAIGTVGSVVAALVLAGWAGLAGRRGRRRLDDREARAEARKVVAIPTTVFDLDEDKQGAVDVREYVEIVNAGDEPILEARMIYGASDKGNEMMRDWQWMHGNGRGTSYASLVLAGDRYRFTGDWQVMHSNDSTSPSEADRGGFYGVIAWSDARDRHWIRRGRDQPVELKKPMTYGVDPQPVHRREASTRTVTDARARAVELQRLTGL
jgi:hypothetical protein